MRLRVAVTTMVLGAAFAGKVLAADATRVIYDLSSLRASPAATAAPAARSEVQVPSQSLPLSSPSFAGPPGEDISDVGDLDVRTPPHGRRYGTSAGSPRGGHGPPDHPGPGQEPSPNPEPGTMMLLGGALASGIRFMRRH